MFRGKGLLRLRHPSTPCFPFWLPPTFSLTEGSLTSGLLFISSYIPSLHWEFVTVKVSVPICAILKLILKLMPSAPVPHHKHSAWSPCHPQNLTSPLCPSHHSQHLQTHGPLASKRLPPHFFQTLPRSLSFAVIRFAALHSAMWFSEISVHFLKTSHHIFIVPFSCSRTSGYLYFCNKGKVVFRIQKGKIKSNLLCLLHTPVRKHPYPSLPWFLIRRPHPCWDVCSSDI